MSIYVRRLIKIENKNRIKYAAAYIRVSTNDQTEYSPEAQKKAIAKYAKDNGYVLLPENIYVDEGISGRKAEKRPAFMQMIAAAKSKEKTFEVILVHKFDRFARSREDSVVYKSLLKKECGVKVISITESIEDDKFSIILEAMMEAMAEYYSINLSEEVKKGMTEKHLRGELQATPAFGYTVKDNILVPVPDEAALVQAIFRKFIAGSGYYAIARWLNDLGIKTHRGNRFENRSIEYIIRNPVYVGKLRWNPAGKSRRDFKNENIVLSAGKHEAIIDQNTWEEAQKRVEIMKTRHKYHELPMERKKDWLSGLVYCAACGTTLVFAKPHYWKCNNYTKGACRFSQHVAGELLKEAILNTMRQDAETEYLLNYNEIHANKKGLDEWTTLEAKLKKVQHSIQRLREAFLAGAESVEEYKQTKQTLEEEAANIQWQLEQLKKKEPGRNYNAELKSAIKEALAVLESTTATMEEKYNAAHGIIEKCIWDKEKNTLQIYYFYPF